MIIKTQEKFELEEKLKIASEAEAAIIKKRLEGLDICNCKHIFIESDASCRGAYGADERWTKYECVNCGLTNAGLDNSEFNMASVKEWSRVGFNSGPVISDECFGWGYIKELYENALSVAEDEFDREEVAFLLKRNIKKEYKRIYRL